MRRFSLGLIMVGFLTLFGPDQAGWLTSAPQLTPAIQTALAADAQSSSNQLGVSGSAAQTANRFIIAPMNIWTPAEDGGFGIAFFQMSLSGSKRALLSFFIGDGFSLYIAWIQILKF